MSYTNEYEKTASADRLRTMTGTFTGPPTGEREKYVPERIADLGKAIEHLNMRIQELESVLAPVLRVVSSPSDGSADKEPRQPFPPLVDQLDRLNDGVYKAVNRLEDILNRLEL